MSGGVSSTSLIEAARRSTATRFLLLTLAVALATAGSLASPRAAAADAGDVGYQGLSYSGTSDPTGSKRSESVLWFNDGSWWASMWDTASADFHIFRLDTSVQRWSDTGVALDTRANTHADVLWDGTHLYVASHRFVNDETPAVSGYPSYLFRYSYNAGTKTYAADAGFPVLINNYRTETLVIDKDSAGTLWATWQQDNKIYINHTLNGDDRTWATPFQLPLPATDVMIDDNSAVVAFGGDKIGIMWSNQAVEPDAMWFAVHVDGEPATTWTAQRTAIQGSGTSDDHMNLKALQVDSGGRVYAAIKTSFTSSAQPLIMLLVREPATGDWTSHSIARVSECPNRPIVVIDEENGVLHSYYTAPAPAFGCNNSGGAIYEKTSPMASISFPTGMGTPVLLDADSPFMHNVSSSKDNVSSATGIALLARNSSTQLYWHQYQPISPGTPTNPPTASFSGAPVSGTAPLAVQFTDESTNNPTSWSWTFGDGDTSSSQNPNHTYDTAGTYTVSLTVANASGSDTETRVDYITVTPPSPPTASFTGTPTSGVVPLTVAFTDTSSGSPSSWAWDFGDGGTSTLQSPSHAYSTAGTYTVALTVTNAGGSDTETLVDYITVTPPPPDFTISASPAKQTIVRGRATSYTVTVGPLNGFTGAVDLSVSGLPAGATASFAPNPIDVTVTRTSTLSITTSSTMKHGSFTLTIQGASGSLRHTATVVLHVKAK